VLLRNIHTQHTTPIAITSELLLSMRSSQSLKNTAIASPSAIPVKVRANKEEDRWEGR
jgi:hypothetical protein